MKNILYILMIIVLFGCDDDNPVSEQPEPSVHHRIFKFDEDYGAACGNTAKVAIYKVPVNMQDAGREYIDEFTFNYNESYTFDFKEEAYFLAVYSFDGGHEWKWWLDLHVNSTSKVRYLRCH